MGVETEFGVAAYDGSRQVLTPEEVARYLFRPVVAQHRSSNVFTANASRLYLDVGSHPEYATAECDSLSQLLAYDKAGERIFHQLSQQCDEALRNDGFAGSTYLFKNNVDSRGNSYGAHENYLISRELALKSFGQQLLPFLITRQLICGAGKIAGDKFVISQRADQVWEGVSSATTRTRPIINTRDEPHGDSHRFRRMHVIVGDSNMSEPTFALKVGSMLLVIEMLEAGFDLPDMELADPIAHIRDIAADPTGATELTLAAGGTVTALEVQQRTLEAAKRWLEQRPDEGTPNEEMARVVDLWSRVLDAIATQDFSGVDTEIDWVIKRKLLTQFKDRLGCGWDHPKLAQIDLTYHDINPERGLFYVLERKGLAARWIDNAAIEKAVDNPPATTRAAVRGEFLTAVRERGLAHNVDWVHLKVNRPEPRTVELQDPFANADDAAADLISWVRAQETAEG
ncbi:Pup--protein ligase [Corynebacterium afermentans subsp. lipophilum]|uniref:Pup--protein ligase n=1 Tax=Corynebacterium afermentans TaxID=38286 RepID=UPI00188C3DE5|nr:Pup--protein ligase [Corynebacterium afermentans]MBF4546531.1 Pup--protein ligase [Corynebacterium afermentans subsp. lipophilum]WJY58893.1 Pup--protein ligase [Corynebacterium afermentans subsp. lipophilum]